ncbi:hypothetical protein [Chishuiella sp.]|uniref:hypothetical protein n=1 Tax=Chishuiella sp. TaxID=1969467 RepID=UPI0028AFF767|nr:hypothetical protein [Chishuiella sp.]
MSIRTRKDCHISTGSQGTYEVCETVPLVDWNLLPQNPKLSTTNNLSSIIQNIQLPELQYIYPLYSSFKYVISFINSSSVDWVKCSASKLNGNVLNVSPGENVDLTYSFYNLDLLGIGITQLVVRCQAFGVKNGIETELNESIEGIIEMSKTDNSGSTFSTNKDVFNLEFNLANNTLSGDKEIIVYSKNNVTWTNQPFNLSVNKIENQTTTSLFLDLKTTSIIEGSYSDLFLIGAEGKSKRVTINLSVVNNISQFYITPDNFDFSLLKSENKTASGVVIVDNPNQLSIELDSYPNFLKSCVFQNNQIKFETKNANDLGVGLQSGNIKLKTDKAEKSIFIKVDVVEHLISDFVNEPYYFALDRKKILLNRVNLLAVKVEMKLEMFFIGYGQTYNEVEIYQLPYFQNKVIFYPGEEVNDFFVKQRNKQSFIDSFDAYQFALVKITLSEIDDSDNLLKNYSLDQIRFVAGYKPKCFPFFTDFSVRRFFSDSNISISAAMIPIHKDVNDLVSRIGQKLNNGYLVRTINFNAKKFNSEYRIENFNSIQFIPIPGSSKIVNIYFETHNLVFDWFTCSADYEFPSDFEHTVSDNVKSGNEEKFETKQTKNITINTGWLLNEEVEVIDAIFNSNFVLIELPDKVIRAIPTAKKNNLGTSEEGFKSLMLEFKILQDER